jgi:c-di-GMP-binding flagellar brake protein YcgR
VFIEQRQAERKALKTKATLAIEGQTTLTVRTVDISSTGMALSLPNPLPIGKPAQIGFELYHDGKVTPFNARCKVSYCIFSNSEFKVGFQFLTLDLNAVTTLAKYLR